MNSVGTHRALQLKSEMRQRRKTVAAVADFASSNAVQLAYARIFGPVSPEIFAERETLRDSDRHLGRACREPNVKNSDG
jgi:hypothetical protein